MNRLVLKSGRTCGSVTKFVNNYHFNGNKSISRLHFSTPASVDKRLAPKCGIDLANVRLSKHISSQTDTKNDNIIASSYSIDSVKLFVDNNIIQVCLNDGLVINFNLIWLRDSCECSQCVHPITRQKLINCADISDQLMADSFECGHDSLKIVWRDHNVEHISQYSSRWLRLFACVFRSTPADHSRAPQLAADHLFYNPKAALPTPVYWDCDLFAKNGDLVKVNYNDFMNNDEYLKSVVELVCKYGVAFIESVPLERDAILSVTRRIAYERRTGYGLTFDVKYNPDPNTHLSYTGAKFDAHVDLAYRERSPGVQLLHCIRQASVGGQSFLVDGYACAQQLRHANREQFDVLCNHSVLFSFCDAERGVWFREKWPIIKVDTNDQIQEIHFSDFSMRPPLLPTNVIAKFYSAYRNLTQIIRNDKYQYKFYMKPGDIIIFNNRRILHGRSEYDQFKENRYLQGCYMDLDEVTSLYEKLNS